MVDLERLAEALARRGLTVAVAESATGGLVGYLLSSAPGASRYFLGGVTAYANEATAALLGVPDEAFAGGAVSEAVALAMARGARELLRADVAVADTGIAGPGGATDGKPVGLTYIGLAGRGGLLDAARHVWAGDRIENKRLSVAAALGLLLRSLKS